MALEAVVFSQDQPLSCYNSFCKDYYNGFSSDPWSYEFGMNNNNNDNIIQWDQEQQVIVNPPSTYISSSPVAVAEGGGGGRRKRRRRSSKNKEEVEQQRITHIAVERNRRKQMNDYLAVIRSLMPPSYSQRGDQASIVGGAINYVKELEQLLQSLQAHKRTKLQDSEHPNIIMNSSAKTSVSNSSNDENGDDDDDDDDDDDEEPPRVFGEFFNFPQYSSHGQWQPAGSCNSGVVSGGKEIEVTMVDGHANVRVLVRKMQRQLLRLVSAFQALRMSVLHLNLTSLHPFVLYSFNLKVEEGCQLNSVDDVAAAVNHILAQIQDEAAVLLQ